MIHLNSLPNLEMNALLLFACKSVRVKCGLVFGGLSQGQITNPCLIQRTENIGYGTHQEKFFNILNGGSRSSPVGSPSALAWFLMVKYLTLTAIVPTNMCVKKIQVWSSLSHFNISFSVFISRSTFVPRECYAINASKQLPLCTSPDG